jgi:hypothetical protein
MATEFYKSIPESIKGKLEEYIQLYSYRRDIPINEDDELGSLFTWDETPEGDEFWIRHADNKTFPQWSDELNRFIDPPQVNTITVNADEYQAMRDWVIIQIKNFYSHPYNSKLELQNAAKQMGIDISEITN